MRAENEQKTIDKKAGIEMDGLAVAALCKDWNERFQRARIDRIHQPNGRELVLTVRTQTGTHRLLLSAHRAFARAHELHRQKPLNPEEPPMFCMLVRKRIEGGRIVGVKQPGWDRVVEIRIEALNDIGDLARYVLVTEIMGKHSNIMLCHAKEDGSPGKIVDSVVHVTPDISRVRQVLPGLAYVPAPPQDKKPYSDVTANDIRLLDLSTGTEKSRRLRLCGLVAGMGPLTAGEVLDRAAAAGVQYDEAIARMTATLYSDTLAGREAPSVGLDNDGAAVAAAPYRLTSLPGRRTVESLDEALDTVYLEAAAKSRMSALAADLERILNDLTDKLRGKLSKLTRELEESLDHDHYRIRGELLTAFAWQVNKGQAEVELPNYYDEDRLLRIELNPALSALENAQVYFRKGSKRKRAIPMLEHEIAGAEADLGYLEEALVHLQDAAPDHLLALRKELEQQGFIKARKSKGTQKRGQAGGALQPDVFVSVDGFTMRVGRNSAQNDRLTLKSSQDNDLWLHTKELPGSHVVISAERRTVPETTLHDAAMLAAWFSKGRNSTNVAVDYTLIKHVWKPNGARPGFVLYDNQKTLFVSPNRERLDEISARSRGH